MPGKIEEQNHQASRKIPDEPGEGINKDHILEALPGQVKLLNTDFLAQVGQEQRVKNPDSTIAQVQKQPFETEDCCPLFRTAGPIQIITEKEPEKIKGTE